MLHIFDMGYQCKECSFFFPDNEDDALLGSKVSADSWVLKVGNECVVHKRGQSSAQGSCDCRV